MAEAKYTVIGIRRKNVVRKKLGALFFKMVRNNEKEIQGIKQICAKMNMDSRSFNTYAGFRVRKASIGRGREIFLQESDIVLIERVTRIFNEFNGLPKDEKRIAHYVFLYLNHKAKHG